MEHTDLVSRSTATGDTPVSDADEHQAKVTGGENDEGSSCHPPDEVHCEQTKDIRQTCQEYARVPGAGVFTQEEW